MKLPLAGTKQEKDISDFFRLCHQASELQELKTRSATLEKQLGKKKAKEDADDEPKKHRGKGKPKEKVEKLIASNTVL